MKTAVPSREQQRFARSHWLWPHDPRWDLHNSYALFRRAFALDRVPRRAPFFITADQSYQLYVNGAFVGRGPARGFQSHWPYDEHDLARWLVPGRNVIAIRAYNPGASNFQYLTQGYAGLLVAAKWGALSLASDRTWKCLPQPGVRHDTVQNSLQLFPQEHFDARACLDDWMESAFDDRAWLTPFTQPFGTLPWASLEPRGIPLLREEARRPGRIVGTAEGASDPSWPHARNIYLLRQHEDHRHQPADADASWFEVPPTGGGRFRSFLVDLGEPVVGNFSVVVTGARGGEVVDFVYTEIVDPATLAPDLRFPDGSRVTLSARLTCRAGRTSHFFYHPFGFRFATVTVRESAVPLQLALAFRRVGYPLEVRGRFVSSDPVLEQIWATCARSQQNCMLDAYVDTPWREQAQWWGDARVQAWNTFFLSGDARLFRRGILQIGAQTTADGVTYGHAPTMAHNCVLPDFTLIWMLTQWDYYWQTGDLSVFRAVQATTEGALRYFETHTGPAGLVTYDPRFWLFLDWTCLPKDGASTVYNTWLLLALERLASLHTLARQTAAAQRCTRWARRLRRTLRGFLNAHGLLTDGLDARGKRLKSTSPHAQTLALMANLAPESAAVQERFLLDYLRDETPHRAQPSAYWITYVYTALALRGHGADIIAHIRPRWQPMVAHGSTFELFRDHPEFPISHSHAWSAHPLFHFMEIIGGIRQAAPAWRRIRFAPVFVGERGGATVPTPHGEIVSAWQRDGDRIGVELTLPRGVTAEVALPGVNAARVTGRRAWSVAAPAVA